LIFPSDHFHYLYIDLEEQNILIFLCESTDLGGHLLARSAVGRKEINEDWAGRYELFEGPRTVCAVVSVRTNRSIQQLLAPSKGISLTCQYWTPSLVPKFEGVNGH
jgi:hypothetical protein